MSFFRETCPNCGYVIEVRSQGQNAKLHALLSDIAKQKQWAGQWLDVEDWKRLITAAWSRASGDVVQILPAIDGHGMDILYRRTSRMSKKEVAELIEYATAWAIEQGVKLEDEIPF